MFVPSIMNATAAGISLVIMSLSCDLALVVTKRM